MHIGNAAAVCIRRCPMISCLGLSLRVTNEPTPKQLSAPQLETQGRSMLMLLERSALWQCILMAFWHANGSRQRIVTLALSRCASHVTRRPLKAWILPPHVHSLHKGFAIGLSLNKVKRRVKLTDSSASNYGASSPHHSYLKSGI